MSNLIEQVNTNIENEKYKAKFRKGIKRYLCTLGWCTLGISAFASSMIGGFSMGGLFGNGVGVAYTMTCVVIFFLPVAITIVADMNEY